VKVEPKTFGTADLKRIRYTMTSVLLEWQTQHFIWTVQYRGGSRGAIRNIASLKPAKGALFTVILYNLKNSIHDMW